MASIPKAKRAKLKALQQRYRQLLAMLPGDMDEFADDVDGSKLAGWELIANEMAAVAHAQLEILDEFKKRK